MAVKVIDLDLATELKPVLGMDGYESLRALVRYRHGPIGWIDADALSQSAVSTDRLAEAIKEQIGWQLVQAMWRERPPGEADAPLAPISVIVCASDRTTELDRCLRAFADLDYPHYEVIVVDTAASVRSTPQSVASLPIRHVREERPGTAHARNRGLAEARYDIVAFLDGDARPDPFWLRAVSRAFAEPQVMAVTGGVAPAELETLPQIQFLHGDYGIDRGLRPRRYRRETITDQELLWANGFGAGHNMAFRKEILHLMGSFSDAFDGSLPSDGSDIEMLHQLLVRHHSIVYEPAALVWYTSPRDAYATRRLAYQHGRAFGTYLRSCARNPTISRLALLRFVLRGWLGSRLIRRMYRPGRTTRRLVLAELRGTLASLLSYKAAGSGARRSAPATGPNVNAKESFTAPLDQNNVAERNEEPIRTKARNGRISVRVIRTLYPHWGAHSGTNQVLKHLNQDRYEVQTVLVQENDNDFPLSNSVLHRQLRYLGQRQDMAWYNLSDLTTEIKSLRYYLYPKADIIHYFDGEHSAQFLPRLHRFSPKVRPKLIMSFHQPPEVLDEVIRKDNIPRYDCVVIISPEQREFFVARTDPEKVRLILLGIDTDYFRPVTRSPDRETIKCVTVGHNYRDYKTVRAVAERLKDDRRIEFHAVSPRPTGLEGLANVTVYKGIDDDRLLQLYQQADILFLPLLKATSNLALLEGMACGLPVVSTVLPSVKTYAPGSEAILVENNDPDSFIDVIRQLAENHEARQTMSVRARKRAEELDWRNIAPQYEALYSEFGDRKK